ncbi:MAG: hypothetical protein ACRDGA_00120 [Bacteroidota bacterium]
MIRNQLAHSHIVIGIATVVVFLGTGLYMRLNFPDLYESNEAIRYLFRANHLYILFAGLLNIARVVRAVPRIRLAEETSAHRLMAVVARSSTLCRRLHY